MIALRFVSIIVLIAHICFAILFPSTSLAASVVLTPTAYTTSSGDSGGQPAANLAVLDQTGSQNTWDKYVEFTTPGTATYAGYRSYTVPATTSPTVVTAMQVRANVLGPAAADQTWTWRVYNWNTSAWVSVGTNVGTSWSSWKLLTFNVTGTFSNFINTSTREIRIGLVSNNTSDNIDVDYEAVTLTTSATNPTSTPTKPPSATPTRGTTTTPIPAPSATSMPTPNPGSASLYVATNGNDNNPGTLASPWRTIQKAANSATAGSTVNVRGGVYNEWVTINVSGSASRPITFQSYAGEQAVIDGTGLRMSAGMNPLVTLNRRDYVVFKKFELRNNTTRHANIVPIGIYVSGGGTGVELRSNRIHTIETTYTGLNGGDAHGIAVYGDTSTAIKGLIVDNNELYDLKLGSSEALVINGNVDGFRVTRNRVHDTNNIGIDAIGYEGVAPSNDRARNGVIASNRVWNVDSSTNPAYGARCKNGVCSGGDTSAGGIYVDGGTQITIENNLVVDANIGIELASEHAGKSTDFITVRNNIISNVDFAGIALGGYDANASRPGGGNARYNTIVNNTVYTPAKGSAFVAQYRVSDSTISNNIFTAGSGQQRVLVSSGTYTNNVEANNLQTTATAGDPNPNNLFVSVNRPSNADLRTGTATSVRQFLHIVAGSAASNAGGSAALAGKTDIDGQARVQSGTIDIGADEAP